MDDWARGRPQPSRTAAALALTSEPTEKPFTPKTAIGSGRRTTALVRWLGSLATLAIRSHRQSGFTGPCGKEPRLADPAKLGSGSPSP